MESNNPLLLNNTLTHADERWWVPLAIALPVCLVGIVLITVLVLAVIVCYSSKFKYKIKKTGSDGKLNSERASQIESTDAGLSGSTYANLEQTVQETKKIATTSEPGTQSNSNGDTNFAKAVWDKTPWRKKTATDLAHSETDRSSEKTDHEVRIVDERDIIDEAGLRTRVSLVGLNGTASKHPGIDATPKTPEDKSLSGQVVLRSTKQKQHLPEDEKDQNKPLEKPNHHSEARKTFVVMYPMESGDDSKLPLSVNDVIIYLDEEEDGWMKGEKKQSGEVGWFPRTHVREGMSPLAKRHSLPKMKDLELAEARPTDFPATTTKPVTTTTTTTTTKMDNQIIDIDDDDFDDVDDDDDDDYETGIEYQALYPYRALEDGDINFDAGDVIVVVERLENGWWRGYRGDEQGFFPGSYVQLKSGETISLTGDNKDFKDGERPSPVEDLSRSVSELLPISAAGEEAEDDDDDGSTTNKKNKTVRRSLGLFLKSFPRKINAGKTSTTGAGAATDQNASVGGDRAKKSSIPWVKKKKKPNLPPLARRCSVAPAPPPSNEQKTVNNALSSIAQMAAAMTVQRSDVPEVTYEEIGTSGVRDRGHVSPGHVSPGHVSGTDISEPILVETTNKELNSGHEEGQIYSNLNGDYRTKLNESNKTSTVPISTRVLPSENLLRPVPPQKPNYSGSTPNIPALFSSKEDTTVLRRQTEKPKVMAKPRNVSPEDAQLERRSIGLPKATKPKPMTAKPPSHVAPGFPDSPGSMRRELCRSLDSVLLGAETAAGEEEEEEEGELEIVKWLQRKLSAEEEEEDVGELQGKSPTLTHQLPIKVNGVNERRKSDDRERMAQLLEDIFKRGPRNEESFA